MRTLIAAIAMSASIACAQQVQLNQQLSYGYHWQDEETSITYWVTEIALLPGGRLIIGAPPEIAGNNSLYVQGPVSFGDTTTDFLLSKRGIWCDDGQPLLPGSPWLWRWPGHSSGIAGDIACKGNMVAGKDGHFADSLYPDQGLYTSWATSWHDGGVSVARYPDTQNHAVAHLSASADSLVIEGSTRETSHTLSWVDIRAGLRVSGQIQAAGGMLSPTGKRLYTGKLDLLGTVLEIEDGRIVDPEQP